MRRLLFAGSFDPFTLGHKSVVDRSLDLADETVIAIGTNEGKKSMFPLDFRLDYIRRIYADEPRVRVMSYGGLTVDFAREVGATCLLRGVRDCKDFEYERQIAEVNRQLTGIETLLLITEERYSCVSSSIVRELIHYGKDVSRFLPATIDIKKD